MRTLKDLDIEKSIKSRKLIFEESWFDKSDSFISYLIFVALGIFSVMCLDQINPQSSNDRVGYYLFPIIIFCVCMVFTVSFLKKISEKLSFQFIRKMRSKKFLNTEKSIITEFPKYRII